jgi:hypothetical protein
VRSGDRPISTHLEVGPKRTFALALDWPAWRRDALLADVLRYAVVPDADKQDAVGQRIVLREVWGDVAAAYVAALKSVTFDSIVERSEQLENRAVYRI